MSENMQIAYQINTISNQKSNSLKAKAISCHFTKSSQIPSSSYSNFSPLQVRTNNAIYSPLINNNYQIGMTENSEKNEKIIDKSIYTHSSTKENNSIICEGNNNIEYYKRQNEKLSMILKEKEIIIYELKQKNKDESADINEKKQSIIALQDLEKKINELLNENEKLNQLVQDKEEKENILTNATDQILSENKKLNDIAIKNQEEIEYKCIIITELTNENEKLKFQLKTNNNEYINLKNKYIALSEQNLKLKELYDEKIKESDCFSELIEKSEALIIENEKMNGKIQEQNSEIDLWKMKFLQIEKLLNVLFLKDKEKNLESPTINEQFKDKINILLTENSRLNELCENMSSETQKIVSKNKDLEILLIENRKLVILLEEKNNIINSLENQIRGILIKIEGLGNLNENPKKSNSFVGEDQKISEKKLNDLQNKLQIMIEENDKLNSIIGEAEFWKEKYYDKINE